MSEKQAAIVPMRVEPLIDDWTVVVFSAVVAWRVKVSTTSSAFGDRK